ncbi:hypothetical protein [Psychroflexus planctonicus]|uniref:Uncharacterized protein n=1 Tax=Psychroflexus planctonicus TaxID=1526575 RepID=A0ABQ1SGT3_9FLAO|nr:hypothetical protein [Psychroflexus planctonicus]GGE34301.1 hypothetical protein GCM10010832_13100 [Psychroflexus planctonicus]
MGDVIITEEEQVHEHLHQFAKPDAFGFSKNTNTYKVNLELNLKAMLLLTLATKPCCWQKTKI